MIPNDDESKALAITTLDVKRRTHGHWTTNNTVTIFTLMLPILFLLHKSVVSQPIVICRLVSCHQIGNVISGNEDSAVVEKLSHSNHRVEAPNRAANDKFIAVTPLEIKPRDFVPSSFREIFQILTFSFRAKWHKEILHSIGQVAASSGEDERRSFPLS
ncbi:hypothetical protein DAPPUDRAFT_252953 [Daphnia pulex]|uniref:Uncharacterized protein n=1 Tax=Daphnia pulex TaxID=6669 RepID=E9H3V7_DAPPU|nr:hypothetical protein DAPPUDRAFT_252953 [Daphnia pulex]|eukprot:EFX73646.1 hypothetical protein DAPPUDRAFT_252953 [Daphnia pulex]